MGEENNDYEYQYESADNRSDQGAIVEMCFSTFKVVEYVFLIIKTLVNCGENFTRIIICDFRGLSLISELLSGIRLLCILIRKRSL